MLAVAAEGKSSKRTAKFNNRHVRVNKHNESAIAKTDSGKWAENGGTLDLNDNVTVANNFFQAPPQSATPDGMARRILGGDTDVEAVRSALGA